MVPDLLSPDDEMHAKARVVGSLHDVRALLALSWSRRRGADER
jgi:hypothetical protein